MIELKKIKNQIDKFESRFNDLNEHIKAARKDSSYNSNKLCNMMDEYFDLIQAWKLLDDMADIVNDVLTKHES